MSIAPQKPVLSLKGPADIVHALPYILGFTPTDSLVITTFSGKRMGFNARLDLTADPATALASVGQVFDVAGRHDVDSVLVVAYESTEGAARLMMETAAERATLADVKVREQLVVRDGRWFNASCPDPWCCPVEGTPIESASRVAAEFVSHGAAPVAAREDLRKVVAHNADADDAAGAYFDDVATVCGDVESYDPETRVALRTAALEGWALLLRSDVAIGPVMARTLAGSLRDIGLRDAIVAAALPGSIPPETFDHLGVAEPLKLLTGAGLEPATLGRLSAFLHVLPASQAAPATTVFGLFAWAQGNGAYANVALDAVRALEPEYRLANLLERMVFNGIRTGVGADAPAGN